MTQAKAQTVISTLIGLGYTVTMRRLIGGEITLRVTTNSSVSLPTVVTFADNQNLTATVQHVDLI